jgi:hypothetical protein
MDDQNPPGHPGEEHHYQTPYSQTGKVTGPGSQLQTQRLLRVFIGIATILLVVVIVFGFVIVRQLMVPSPNTPSTGVLATSTTANGPSRSGVTPTASAATPSSTSTSLITIGTVLCQPKASDWPQTNDWQTVGTEYVNKDGNSTPIVAPCNIPVSDYYVEVQIRTSQSSFGTFMGVLARLNQEKKVGYKGGIFYGTFCGENCGEAELDDLLNSQRNTAKFGTFPPNTIATVKLQVKGTDITLYVNNNLVVEEHYTSANDAGKVGLECDQTCEVLQFTVVAQ